MATKTLERRSVGVSPVRSLYDRDFYAWTVAQAAAIRDGDGTGLDREKLVEAIEDLGEEVFKGLRSSFRIILIHMLKWDHQPQRRSRSWTVSIRTQRIEVETALERSPSLRRREDEALEIAYRQARIRAAAEIKVSERELPVACPYAIEEIMSRPFDWPGG